MGVTAATETEKKRS